MRGIEKRIADIQVSLKHSPLEAVGSKLIDYLKWLLLGIETDTVSSSAMASMLELIDDIFSRVPKSFGDRFDIDALLLREIMHEWEGPKTRFPTMIVPSYGNEWTHSAVGMPPENKNEAHVVKIITFPGEDILEDVDLLDYAFLFHELAHELLSLSSDLFRIPFNERLDARLRAFRRRSIADGNDVTKRRHQDVIDNIDGYWRATNNRPDWAHEFAADIVALWACGPVYTDRLVHTIRQKGLRPFELKQEHPPYAARFEALSKASFRLGWPATKTDGLLEYWEKTSAAQERSNEYFAAVDDEILNHIVEQALETCKVCDIPLCTPERLKELEASQSLEDIPGLGTDLLLRSWLINDSHGELVFSRWASRVLTATLD